MSTSKTATEVQPVRWVASWSLVLVVDERRRTHHRYAGQPLPEGVAPAEVDRLVSLGAVRAA